MIGNSTLLFMHLRLQEMYQTFNDPDGWFGGKTVVFFGDLCQLAPVGQSPPYNTVPLKQVKNLIGGSCSVNLWRDHITYDELTQNVLQAADSGFPELTARV